MVADKNFSLTFSADKVEVSKAGDLAYSQGAYTATMTNPRRRKWSRKQASSSRSIEAAHRRLEGGCRYLQRGWSGGAAKHRASPAPAPHKHHKSTARKR